MSAADREELADALAAVPGLRTSPYPLHETRQGTASIRLGRLDRAANGFGLVATWQVWIVTGQDLAAAEKWIDGHHDAITAALHRHLILRSVQPAETTIGTTKTNVVIYEGTR